MIRAYEHLKARGAGGLALDPGMRKTSITLKAFCDLKAAGTARTMLVVAPLRVCRTVWRQEGAKWSEFRHLKFSLLHGSKKEKALREVADVYLVNPEGLPWLCKLFQFSDLPFDVVTIDELTKFKNPGAKTRGKILRPRLKKVRHRWGLTGSLAPNGYMDLFGQQLMLDDGAALGRFVTLYRSQHFTVDFNGFDYNLIPGHDKKIMDKLAPYWLQLSADDYLQLPPLVTDIRYIDFTTETRRTYEKMRLQMLAQLPGGTVTAANAAACYSKLSQMANGAVYIDDLLSQGKNAIGTNLAHSPGIAAQSGRVVAHIHDLKLDALEELLEELNGKPLLIAYEFNHDLERLRARFGANLPYLGKGTTAKQEEEWIAAWNANRLPFLCCHPASAGHGLNLQEGNAAHIAWLSPIWDLELWDQFIRRVRRSGNEAQRVFNHIFAVRDTIDELKIDALNDKDVTQSRLLRLLNAAILREADAPAGGEPADVERERRIDMAIARLTPRPDVSSAAAPTPAVTPPAAGTFKPASWGNQGGDPAVKSAEPTQQGRIQTLISPARAEVLAPTPPPHQLSAFSAGVQTQAATLAAPVAEQPPPPAAEATAAPKTRTRTRKADVEAAEAPPFNTDTMDAALVKARAAVLGLAFGPTFDPQSVEEGLDIARDLMKFVQEG